MKKILFFLVFSFVLLLGSQATAQATLTGGSNDTFKEGQELVDAIKLFYRELSTVGNGEIDTDAQTQVDVQANTVLVLEYASRNDVTSLDQVMARTTVDGSGLRAPDSAVVNNAYEIASEYYVNESLNATGSTINVKNNAFLDTLLDKISK